MSKTSVKILAVIMAAMLPASIMSAETGGAMLFVSNSAVVNGGTIARNSAIFSGDKIDIPANSSATITLTGSSVVVPSRSTVTFHGDSVAVGYQSAVAVTTTMGMAAQIENIHITPASRSAKFQVGRYNGMVVVAAKQGNVLISGVAGGKEVAEGGTLTISDPAPQKPGAVPATTGVGVAAGELPTWVAVLIGVAAAGTAAAVALASTGNPLSPQ